MNLDTVCGIIIGVFGTIVLVALSLVGIIHEWAKDDPDFKGYGE